MKYLLLLVYILFIIISCSYNKKDDIRYDVYSSLLEKEFGHLKSLESYKIGINDTIRDFKDDFETLIYSVQNNKLFFKEYCQGDSSFKQFIFSINRIDRKSEVINIEKLKSRSKIKIAKKAVGYSWKDTINFSVILFNAAKNKAILFVTQNSSGSWFFMESNNEKWTVSHEIISYTL